MANLNLTSPAHNAQTSIVNQQNSRFCASCQFGNHCGGCVCCSGHHLSSTRIILSDNSIVTVPDGADPDAYRRYCEGRIRQAANPKPRKQTKRNYTPRSTSRRASFSLPFDSGLRATAGRMAELATEEPEHDAIFVGGFVWDMAVEL